MKWNGRACFDLVWPGTAGVAWNESFWCGLGRRGWAGLDLVRLGRWGIGGAGLVGAWRDLVRQASLGKVRLGEVGLGVAGMARRGEVGIGVAWRGGPIGFGMAGQVRIGWVRLGWDRQVRRVVERRGGRVLVWQVGRGLDRFGGVRRAGNDPARQECSGWRVMDRLGKAGRGLAGLECYE